jgi:hypothetical protein
MCAFLVPSVLTHLPPQWYRHAHSKDMPLRAIARLIQTLLYGRRFFPYYVYNILGGIEEDGSSNTSPSLPLSPTRSGTGAVYSFDPVGSYEREACRAAGAAQSLVQPFLDNQVCYPLFIVHISDAYNAADLFHEPKASTGHIASGTLATCDHSVDSHRFVHERDGTPHRGVAFLIFVLPQC